MIDPVVVMEGPKQSLKEIRGTLRAAGIDSELMAPPTCNPNS